MSETNSNYANLVTLYDRLLGTYTPADRAASVVYGLADANPATVGSFSRLLSTPFRASLPPTAPDTKVRITASAGR